MAIDGSGGGSGGGGGVGNYGAATFDGSQYSEVSFGTASAVRRRRSVVGARRRR